MNTVAKKIGEKVMDIQEITITEKKLYETVKKWKNWSAPGMQNFLGWVFVVLVFRFGAPFLQDFVVYFFFVLCSRSFSASSILLSNLYIFLHQLLHFFG